MRVSEGGGVLSATGDSRMGGWMEVQNVFTDQSLFSIVPVSHAAIYLCKRTMQNKTRLDLADYEAVSSGL